MQLIRNPLSSAPRTLGILPGAFNPLTTAHLALADAARRFCDLVVLAVPRSYPHKPVDGASPTDRLAMLEQAGSGYAIALSDGGLFLELAEEARLLFAPAAPAIHLICGRDAAERILAWDYGPGFSVEAMLASFSLLVAARQGEHQPPPHLAARVRSLELPGGFDEVSSTTVRERIARGEPWRHLVPAAIADLVERIYTPPR